jgi:hypothetical protein
MVLYHFLMPIKQGTSSINHIFIHASSMGYYGIGQVIEAPVEPQICSGVQYDFDIF